MINTSTHVILGKDKRDTIGKGLNSPNSMFFLNLPKAWGGGGHFQPKIFHCKLFVILAMEGASDSMGKGMSPQVSYFNNSPISSQVDRDGDANVSSSRYSEQLCLTKNSWRGLI